MLKRLFKLEENKTTVKTELLAGLTTFLAMSYILAVNPIILSSAGMDKGGVLIATALAAGFGTILMAILTNYPFALAPAMGLNAFFAFSVVSAMGYSWQFALFAVFCEGIIFLLLSVSNLREMIFNGIPMPLKQATSVGIGFFIAFIGLRKAGLIVDDKATLLTLGSFTAHFNTLGISSLLACIGIIVTVIMLHKQVRGAILLGIFISWGLGIVAELTGLYVVDASMECYSLIPNFSFSMLKDVFQGFAGLFCGAFDAESWSRVNELKSGLGLLFSLNFIVIVFSFLFIDLFSAIGTLTGLSIQAKMLDKDNKLPRIKGAFVSDSIATSAGAVLGTSTISSYVESAAGIAEGGRTGLTSIVTALLFIVSILFAPLLLSIPAFATAPALIIVGFYMLRSIVEIDFNDYTTAIPAYLAIIIIPLSNSITDGICFGIISWTILNLVTKRYEKVPLILIILSLIFILKYIYL